MTARSVAPRLGRGLTLQGHVLFTHKRVCVWTAGPTQESRITWTWPTASAEDHLGWFLERLAAILGPGAVMGDCQEWRTVEQDTHEPLLLHGWLCGIKLDMPHTGARATMLLTLAPDVVIEH